MLKKLFSLFHRKSSESELCKNTNCCVPNLSGIVSTNERPQRPQRSKRVLQPQRQRPVDDVIPYVCSDEMLINTMINAGAINPDRNYPYERNPNYETPVEHSRQEYHPPVCEAPDPSPPPSHSHSYDSHSSHSSHDSGSSYDSGGGCDSGGGGCD